MTITMVCRRVATLAALLALSTGASHAQKTAARESAAAQGPRGLLSGKASPQVVQRADGSQEIESDESMLHYSVAVRQPDGKLAYYCVHNADDARRISAGELKPTKQMEHSHDR